ncbi:MAG: cysteine--1-D-myo-inosityl 2-amino-2-deoxy-alpha-D-glucopyranoside ligase [Actinomycetota bacterium]|nr:cysteine--1-D-myo-inosityl 2-amino-2-deoxy-alpha-D-glucopyranoside ligase [Actinomycetota bacterium]MDQ2956390.1 cysteine--1-D-myo-inosityl 2-amino-2-deoxy-alpha-D-glucopyranoside ligase [Actinomycetota bacterium]
MRSWSTPEPPVLPGSGRPLRLYDTATDEIRPTAPGATARLYVCGITPYDATHLGHAATYLAFDLVQRIWRDAGHAVRYVQNVTDVDDPLLERATATGIEWNQLAEREIQLFREDMADLRVLPPDDYVGVVESVDEIADGVGKLLADGLAYRLDTDIYATTTGSGHFGYESRYTEAEMLTLSAERGGDPDRPGKRDRLDALLWRGQRPGEPSWPTPLGAGRPGWHVECSVIALNRLGMGIDVQGGGSDLRFPHHEHSAAHAEALTGQWPFAKHYCHAGMIGLDGEKMSKSRGNLVFVSKLRGAGVDPMAIRLALLDGHYRADREWTGGRLPTAERRLARWRAAVATEAAPDPLAVLDRLRERLADDLDTVAAINVVDRWAEQALQQRSDADVPQAGIVVGQALDALLGIAL